MAARVGMGAAGDRNGKSQCRDFLFDAAWCRNSGRTLHGCGIDGCCEPQFHRVRKRRTPMIQHATVTAKSNLAAIKALTYLMFMMLAMTTDSVGVIIPEIIKQFGLSMTAAGA